MPASVDWVKLDKLSPIQDQGNCGAGWAFTAVAAVESAIAIKSLENSTIAFFTAAVGSADFAPALGMGASAVPKLSEQ